MLDLGCSRGCRARIRRGLLGFGLLLEVGGRRRARMWWDQFHRRECRRLADFVLDVWASREGVWQR